MAKIPSTLHLLLNVLNHYSNAIVWKSYKYLPISESQSFIFTSSNGGTLYIKPLDLSAGDLEKMSLDGIIDSIGDMDNSYTYAMGGWSKPISLNSLYNREKHTQTNGSQTPPQYEYISPQPYHVTPPNSSKSKKNANNFPPLNKCGTMTTTEDLEARRFVQEFKARRVAHKLTQSDIGERLNRCTGARYGQSYISRLESMQLSTAIVLRMKPLLNRLLDETENGMFAEGLENMELYHPPTRKKSKSNSGGSKSRKSKTPNYQREIDGQAPPLKTPYQRSASVPAGSTNIANWNYQVPHHHNLGNMPPTTYQEQGNNFFISGVLSSLNPGVMTTRSDTGSSCKVSDPMEVALSHSQLYNPYRMPDLVEPKHEVIELSPVQPRPPHPSPAGLLPGDENNMQRHHDNMRRPAQQHDNMHHQMPATTHSFSPNLHELTATIKSEPQITTLQPPLKPGWSPGHVT